MRVRDIEKQKAVIEATIKVINEIGFASASISKIAKEAGVSVGTIYIYYKNKEDLVVSVYYDVKQEITNTLYQNMDDSNSVKANLNTLWNNTIKASEVIPMFLSYSEQFANSPFYDLVDKTKLYEFAKPLIDLQIKGIEDKVLKTMTFEVFIAFFITPATFLSNRKLCAGFKINAKNIEDSFQIAWNTIKQ
jgi:AcrR family transcriptional regulator